MKPGPGWLSRALSDEKGQPSASRLIGFVGLLLVCPVLLNFALPDGAKGTAFDTLAFTYAACYGVMKIAGAFTKPVGTTTTEEHGGSKTTVTVDPPAETP